MLAAEDECAAPDVLARPVLVVGSQRSGTTLLNRMLDAHTAIGMLFQQTDFWRVDHRRWDPLRHDQIAAAVRGVAARARANDAPFPEGLYDAILNAATTGEVTYAWLYARIVRGLLASSVERWGEKYAGAALEAPRFLETFPAGQVVHIVRDVRDVLASERRRLRKAGATEDGALLNLWYWKTGDAVIRAMRRAFRPSAIHVVRYEDLVRSPEQTASELCAFLGLPFDARMLDATGYRDARGLPWEANSSFASGVRRITPDPVGRWRDVLDEHDVAFAEATCGRELVAHGYPLTLRSPDLPRERENSLRDSLERYREDGSLRPFISRKTYRRVSTGAATGLSPEVIVRGTGGASWALGAAVQDLGLSLLAFEAPEGPALWGARPVLPSEMLARTDAARELAPPRLRFAAPFRDASARLEDEAIRPLLPSRTRLARRDLLRALPESAGSEAAWTLSGAGTWSRGVDVAALGGGAGLLTSREGLVSLTQRVEIPDPSRALGLMFGAWVRCDAAARAQLLLSGDDLYAQSGIHPGDRTWRFLAISVQPGKAQWVAAHLLVLSAGSARFARPMLLPFA